MVGSSVKREPHRAFALWTYRVRNAAHQPRAVLLHLRNARAEGPAKVFLKASSLNASRHLTLLTLLVTYLNASER